MVLRSLDLVDLRQDNSPSLDLDEGLDLDVEEAGLDLGVEDPGQS